MTRRIQRSSAIHRAAPVLSLMLIIGSAGIMSRSATSASQGVEAGAVVDAMQQVPYRIGTLVGTDIPLPEETERALRSEATFSRRYVDLHHGHSVDVLVLYCTDARDMIGHDPPICYPSNGWSPSTRAERTPSHVHKDLGDRHVTFRVHHFSRADSIGRVKHISIFNLFLLPHGRITHDMREVTRRTNWLGPGTPGVAQVQILVDSNIPESRAVAIAGDILVGLSPLLLVMGDSRHVQPE